MYCPVCPFCTEGRMAFAVDLTLLGWVIAGLTAAVALSPWRQRARPLILAAGILLLARYLLWRSTATLNFSDAASAFIGLGLLAAEGFVFINWLLTVFQLWRPTEHKTPPLLPPDTTWPSVDVCITVYNEPPDILRRTLTACLAMDYPAKKTVWVLDDGRSSEVKKLARQLGGRYISRPDNRHAKAGNLNH